MFSIYSLTPAPWGDQFRYVESFDRYEDAKKVWDCLESVNISFNCYKIIDESKPYKYYFKELYGD